MNYRIKKSELEKKLKATLPPMVNGSVVIKDNTLSLRLRWKNTRSVVSQESTLLRYFSETFSLDKKKHDEILTMIGNMIEGAVKSFGKSECDYLIAEFSLTQDYIQKNQQKEIIYNVEYLHERKTPNTTTSKNLDFYLYDEIKVTLPYLYTLWILLIKERLKHKNYNEITEVTESLIETIKQLFFTKELITQILSTTKHFGNPTSFFVFYYHFNYFLSIIKTLGDNLSWLLRLYLNFRLRHNYIELDSSKFKQVLRRFPHYYDILYNDPYFSDFTTVNDFRNITQHRHIIRSMKIVLNWTGKNKILVPKDPDVQISKGLTFSNRKSTKQHVKLAEDKESTILTGAHDYTFISRRDLIDYDDPIQFCEVHVTGITKYAEKIINCIVNDITRKKIGRVVNYYSKILVAEIELLGEINNRAAILIEGSTTSFTQEISEIRAEGTKIEKKSSGIVTIKLNEKARINDIVYRIPRINNSTYLPHLLF